jgi:hypothetical protein
MVLLGIYTYKYTYTYKNINGLRVLNIFLWGYGGKYSLDKLGVELINTPTAIKKSSRGAIGVELIQYDDDL